MKHLLYIAFILSSTSSFSQEKGPICSLKCYLYHQNDSSAPSDFYWLHGTNWSKHTYNGIFQHDAVDTSLVEINLFTGDSLIYHGEWTDWGPCITPDLEVEDVADVITIVEGGPFLITTVKTISSSPDWDYSVSQDAVIKTSCLLELKSYVPGSKSHFVRVKFTDAPVEEQPASVPELSNDVTMWFSNETKLTVKADEGVLWNLKLYSLSGELIQVNELQGEQELDLSRLSRGCYVVHVAAENGITKQLKFIR